MTKKSFGQLGLQITTTISLTILTLFSTISVPISADWRSQYDQQKREINSQMDEVNAELGEMTQKITEISSLKSSLKEQVAASESEIEKLETMIDDINLSISQLKAQIDYKETEIDTLKDQMSELLKEMQRTQRVSPIELILTSQSLGEAVGKVYNLSAMQVKADELKAELETALAELEEDKAKLEESQKTLEDAKLLAESEKSSLEVLLAETEGEEDKYQAWVAALKDQEKQLEAKEAQIEKEIAEEQARQDAANNPGNGGGTGNGGGSGGYQPPAVPGNCFFEDGGSLNANLIRPAAGVMTDNFGCPSRSGRWHDGIDIANGLNTPIKSTAGGTIHAKGSYNVAGYGHWVMVKHTDYNGKRFYSLYAHLNSASPRSVGQYVNQGDTIGYMGTTGISTGVHLHFMLYASSYESSGLGCRWGSSKCYNPARFISF